MPVYQGRDSCYARKEGMYVRRIQHPGIDTVTEAVGILHLIARDYKKGWTYENRTCRKVRMTRKLFVRRARYVLTLSRKHGASASERAVIKRLITYVIRDRRVPKRFKAAARRAIAKVRKR